MSAGLPAGMVAPMSHPGLELRAELGKPGPIAAGDGVAVTATLRNVSAAPIPVVQVGDGSEMAWREPFVFYTAEHDQQPVDKLDFGRCGNFDSDWGKDVVQLAPGAELALELQIPPDYFVDLQQPGTTELVLHYRYSAGRLPRETVSVPATMKNVAAYEVVSNAMRLTVERRLEVQLTVTSPLSAGEPKHIEDLFSVRLHNHDRAAREVIAPSSDGSLLYFEIEDADDVPRPDVRKHYDAPKQTASLAPGDGLTILGKGSPFDALHDSWTVERKGELRVRVVFQGIRSAWTRVTVR
jgi:hypothetical protein